MIFECDIIYHIINLGIEILLKRIKNRDMLRKLFSGSIKRMEEYQWLFNLQMLIFKKRL